MAFKPWCKACGGWHFDYVECHEDHRIKTWAATYIGPTEKLHGQEALIRDDPNDRFGVLAQFNGFKVDGAQVLWLGGQNLAAGWHPFPRSVFVVG